MATIATVVAEIQADTRKFHRDIDRVHGKLKTIENRAKSFGRKWTMMATLPVVAGLGMMAKTAISVESAFTGVEKTVDATAEELAEMREGFIDMSKRMPVAIEDLMGIGEAAGQLGISTDNILNFTETIAQLAATTDMTAEAGAFAFARIANITSMAEEDFSRLGSVVVDLGNNMATTESEITEMGLRLAGAANTVGLTQDEILSLSAALTSVGIRAEAGGSSLSRVMQDIFSYVAGASEEVKTLAEVSGVSVEKFTNLFKRDASEALTIFIEGLGRLQEQGVDLTPVMENLGWNSIRIRDALTRTAGAGDLVRKAFETGADAWKENIAMTEEFRKRLETTGAKLEIFKNKVKALADTFGQKLLPIMDTLLEDYLGPAADEMESMSGSTQVAILAVAGLVAVIGPLSWAIGGIIGGFAKLAKVATALLSPLGAVAVTAASLGYLVWKMYENWELGLARLKMVIYYFASWFLKILETIMGDIPFIGDKIEDAAEKLRDMREEAEKNVDALERMKNKMGGEETWRIKFEYDTPLPAMPSGESPFPYSTPLPAMPTGTSLEEKNPTQSLGAGMQTGGVIDRPMWLHDPVSNRRHRVGEGREYIVPEGDMKGGAEPQRVEHVHSGEIVHHGVNSEGELIATVKQSIAGDFTADQERYPTKSSQRRVLDD